MPVTHYAPLFFCFLITILHASEYLTTDINTTAHSRVAPSQTNTSDAAVVVAYSTTMYGVSVNGPAPSAHTLTMTLMDWVGAGSEWGVDEAGVDIHADADKDVNELGTD